VQLGDASVLITKADQARATSVIDGRAGHDRIDRGARSARRDATVVPDR